MTTPLQQRALTKAELLQLCRDMNWPGHRGKNVKTKSDLLDHILKQTTCDLKQLTQLPKQTLLDLCYTLTHHRPNNYLVLFLLREWQRGQLQEMTKKELQALCREKKWAGYSGLNKAPLIDLILAMQGLHGLPAVGLSPPSSQTGSTSEDDDDEVPDDPSFLVFDVNYDALLDGLMQQLSIS